MRRRYYASKQRWLDSIHQLYLSGNEDTLFRLLRPVITSKARMYGRRWKWTGISEHDFNSEFWEVAWRLYEKPYERSNYTYYETLVLAIGRKVIDMVRHATRGQAEFDRDVAYPGDNVIDIPDGTDVESTVVNRLYVESLLHDVRLSQQDRQLLQVIYANPDATQSDIAKLVGLQWRTQLTRQLERIRECIASTDINSTV